MYLKIGAYLRPFNEASVDISYAPKYSGAREMLSVVETWEIRGRIINSGSDATQSKMSEKIRRLRTDVNTQPTPDLIFYEDDGTTATPLRIIARDMLWGPNLIESGFPNREGNVYATGYSYRLVYEAERPINVGGALLEFSERFDEIPGGLTFVHVGGAVGPAQKQVGRQMAPYRYFQTGTALGLYGYPAVPPPIFPNALVRQDPRITRDSAEEQGLVPTRWRISWEYEYENAFKLYGRPHSWYYA